MNYVGKQRPWTDAFVSAYWSIPAKVMVLRRLTAVEGGQMLSPTLRRILLEHYGVVVGLHSYGSLLDPSFADRGTDIGRYVSVGPNVRRIGAAHPIDAPSLHPYWYNPALGYVGPEADVERTGCRIEHDAWIGANTTILPGCRRIGIGAVVGAASVLTSDVPDFAVVVGNPARLIRYRFDERRRNQVRSAAAWELEPADARHVLRTLGVRLAPGSEDLAL